LRQAPQELPDGRSRVAYDPIANAITPHRDAAASEIAWRLDAEVLTLLHEVTEVLASRPA
jgi:acetylglutamate kinase